MKKLRRKKFLAIIFIIILLVAIIFLENISYATTYSKGAIEMQTDKNEVNMGDTFTISVLIPGNMSNSSRSIKEAEATLMYDSNSIKCIKTHKLEYYCPSTIMEKEGKIEYKLEPYSPYAVGSGSILFTVTFQVVSDNNISLRLLYDSTERYYSTKI